LNSMNYYDSVVKMVSKDVLDASYRLFMVPGMAHCRGGEGPASFDAIAALERWVESRVPPDSITASRIVDGKVDRTRPLCRIRRLRDTGAPDPPTTQLIFIAPNSSVVPRDRKRLRIARIKWVPAGQDRDDASIDFVLREVC
jgi:hypothetical protein